jgi:chemotaxis protein methyltransferase CheR
MLDPSFSVETVLALVCERTGLSFPPSRRTLAEAGVRRMAERAAVADPLRYRELLVSDPAAMDELVAELTVGETYFFREPEQLAFIRKRVLPELQERRDLAAPMRVWSAGCASGEEAYTLAILLCEAGVRSMRVLGTDLSRERLARARQARYTRWSLRGLPAELMPRYFRRRGNEFEVTPFLRQPVEFGVLNLAEDAYPSISTGVWGMDLILCRNVLIYLDRDTVAKVARRLVDSLSDTGWLFLGASDPPIGELVACEVVMTGAGLAYRKRPTGRAIMPPAPRAGLAQPAPPQREPAVPPLPRPIPPRPAEPTPPAPAAMEADDAAARYAAGDYAGAADAAARQTARDPGEVGAWILRIRALANQGRLAEAGRACAEALERHPRHAELLYLHAVLLCEAARFGDAAAAARRALYLDRSLAVAHLALGTALARIGDRAGARRAMRNAERLLAAMPPQTPVPAADGEPAGRLAEIARVQQRLLMEAA